MQEIEHIDIALFLLLNKGIANPVFDVLCPLFRNKFFWIPVYVLIFAWFAKKYKWKAIWILAFAGLVILLCDQISASLIKPYFARLRPCNTADLANEMRTLVRCGSGFSFVSSHAANHFGLSFYLILFFKNKLVKLLLLFWATIVSFSQIYVGVHFPLDVLCGALLGAVIGVALACFFRKYIYKSLTENIH